MWGARGPFCSRQQWLWWLWCQLCVVVAWPEPIPLRSNGNPAYWVSLESCKCHQDSHIIILGLQHWNDREKEKKVVHIVPNFANYLSFLTFLGSVSYALVFLMPWLMGNVEYQLVYQNNGNKQIISPIKRGPLWSPDMWEYVQINAKIKWNACINSIQIRINTYLSFVYSTVSKSI